MKRFLLTLCTGLVIIFRQFSFSHPLLYADENNDREEIANFESEEDIEEAEQSGDITVEMSDWLKNLYENPININAADETELTLLPGIGSDEAKKIVEERLEGGPYEKTDDLLSRGAIDENPFEKIKLFIKAGKTDISRSRGELKFETIAASEDSPESGISSSNNEEELRLKIKVITERLRVGGLYLRERVRILESAAGAAQLRAQSMEQSRFLKGYAGYDQGNINPRKSGEIFQQVYIGNYRADFFEEIEKTNSTGFYPDDRTTSPSAVGVSPEYRKHAFLRGVAHKAAIKKLSYASFYSNDTHPYFISVVTENPDGSESRRSSATVQDILEIKTAGGYLNFSTGERTHIGAFWTRNSIDLIVPSYNRPVADNLIWGCALSKRRKGLSYRTLFSRVDGSSKESERNFYFGRLFFKPVKTTNMTLTYKRAEPGYLNPAGEIFSGGYLWNFSATLSHRLQKNFSLRLDFGEKKESRSEEESTALHAYWNPSPKMALQAHQFYSEKNFLRSPASDENYKDESYGKFRSKLRVIHIPSKILRHYIDFEMGTVNRKIDAASTSHQAISYGIAYQFRPNVKMLADLKTSDPDTGQAGSETHSFRIALQSTFFKKLNINISWENGGILEIRKVSADTIPEQTNHLTNQDRIRILLSCQW